MANEKSNNVRILQSTQKNNLPPMVHAAIGFLVGIALIIVIGLAYIYLFSDEEAADGAKETVNSVNKAESNDRLQAQNALNNETEIQNTRSNEDSFQSKVKTEPLDDKDEDDLYSNDLAVFSHPTHEKAKNQSQNVQNSGSPFDITQLNKKAPSTHVETQKHPVAPTTVKAKTNIQPPVQAKATPVKTVKPAESSKPAEVEHFEEPMGGTQISVTKRVKEVSTPAVATSTP